MCNPFDIIKAISVNVILYFDVDAVFRPVDSDVLFLSLLLTIFIISNPFNNIAVSDIKIVFLLSFYKENTAVEKHW